MNKEVFQWLVLSLILISLASLSAFTINQRRQLAKISNDIAALHVTFEHLTRAPVATRAVQASTWTPYLNTYHLKPLKEVKSMNAYVKVFTHLLTEPCDPTKTDGLTECDAQTKTQIDGNLTLYAEPSWKDGNVHNFYLEFASEGPAAYYGPFSDNVLRLFQDQTQTSR